MGRNAGVDLIFKKKIMISLKFGREKRIWQSFLLTNYCNFPRRIFVTGGKHKASKRSDLPLFPSSCLLDTEVGGKPPCFDFSAGCSSEHPQLPWLLFYFHLFFWFWKTGSFPLLSTPVHVSVIKCPTWQFYNDKRQPSKMFSFTGAWHGCQTPREKLFPSFPGDPAWVLGL